MKRTKILATYGPSIASEATLKRLVKEGVNAFRVNCSHGSTDDLRAAAKAIRQATADSTYPIGLLFDISGPKLRLDRFNGEIDIDIDTIITLTVGTSDLSKLIVGVNHPAIIESVAVGHRLFIDDGKLGLEIVSADGKQVRARAMNAGKLLPGKGINLPDTALKIPTITEKDHRDIITAIECGADFIALSFVRSGDDIIEARRIIRQHGGTQQVIAKLEKREAVETLETIILLADGVMIARGDLGVELPPAELPRLQKRIIYLANCHHKPVIVATQMLESMRTSPRATRAEINDVASAVFDYADTVMLSAETASGEYPVEAVRTMSDVIVATEEVCRQHNATMEKHLIKSPIAYAIAQAVSQTNEFCDTQAIFAFTTSGFTAGLISNLFPVQPVVALTPIETVARQLTLYRSVYSVLVKHPPSFDDMLATVNTTCKQLKLASPGDSVIITGGVPFGFNVPTNFMLIHEVA
jgi:pyruvate kinase